MEQRKRFKTILLTLVLIGVLTGAGFGASQAFRHSNPAVSTESAISQPVMIPGNFSELAEKFDPGWSIFKWLKRYGTSA